jgi:hypothetical protein
MSAATHRWLETNQRLLVEAIGEVRTALEQHAAHPDGARACDAQQSRGESEPPSVSELAEQDAADSALAYLCARLDLTAFERAILVLCAGVELDGSMSALCGAAQGKAGFPYPTFGLALAALPAAHWSALAPDRPLRRWRLVEIIASPGTPITASPLRIDERILHFLTGLQQPDERLTGLIESVRADIPLLPSQVACAQQFVSAWSRDERPMAVMQLCGDDPLSKRAIVAAACEALGLGVIALTAESIPPGNTELAPLLRLLERECLLTTSALYVDADAVDPGDAGAAAPTSRLLERIEAPVAVGSRERWRTLRRDVLTLDVERPPHDEQRALWVATLGDRAAPMNGRVEELTAQFDLGAHAIRAVARESTALGGELGERLWDASRAQARPRLEPLAQRIESSVGWYDLILPAAQLDTLHEIVTHVRQRRKVYDEWGFGGTGARGLGVSALFAGASGTGKTLAAEVLANELRLDLYRIDLSRVVDKYIGETEKNLRRIFDAAEGGGTILLFDEADALFGKRSEVKDSHDRYANIEVSYLLQRMESYRGLAILTTNLKSALDTAFLRRIRFVVQFPFPDERQRTAIWRRAFPAATPRRGVDVRRLAQLNVAGGNIRNIALNAAFLAADAGEPVRMKHLLRATRSECAKIETTLSDTELAGWE